MCSFVCWSLFVLSWFCFVFFRSFLFCHFRYKIKENVAAVNEALSELYIEDEDHDKLRESVDDYDNFDQVNYHTMFDRPYHHVLTSFFNVYSEKIPKRSVLDSAKILRRVLRSIPIILRGCRRCTWRYSEGFSTSSVLIQRFCWELSMVFHGPRPRQLGPALRMTVQLIYSSVDFDFTPLEDPGREGERRDEHERRASCGTDDTKQRGSIFCFVLFLFSTIRSDVGCSTINSNSINSITGDRSK